MKMAARTVTVYLAAIVLLLLAAYFVQTDTRRVSGTSMLPTLEGGDLVVVQPVSISDVKVGDIIVYNELCSTGGESVIHRVVGFQSGGLITKGDNNRGTDQTSGIADGPITQQCIVGRVVFVIPYVELIAYYIDQQELPSWFSFVPAALILLIVLYLILGERDEKESSPGKPNPGR